MTRRSSFANLHNWKEELEKVVGQKPSVLVGNKLDLANGEFREVASTDGEALKGELNSLTYHETSAKDDINIGPAFEDLVIGILKNSGKI